MCPSAPRVCSEPGGQKPVLSLSLDLIQCQGIVRNTNTKLWLLKTMQRVMSWNGTYKMLSTWSLKWFYWLFSTILSHIQLKVHTQQSNYDLCIKETKLYNCLKFDAMRLWMTNNTSLITTITLFNRTNIKTSSPDLNKQGSFCVCAQPMTDDVTM